MLERGLKVNDEYATEGKLRTASNRGKSRHRGQLEALQLSAQNKEMEQMIASQANAREEQEKYGRQQLATYTGFEAMCGAVGLSAECMIM